MRANMATGLADEVRVWQNPAAAVEAKATATGFSPSAIAAGTTSGTSTEDRAVRDWITRCAATLTATTTTRNSHGGPLSSGPNTAPASQPAAPEVISAAASAAVAAMNSSSDHGTPLR